MEKSVISVIMPVYNSEKHVASSVYSILSQTFTNFEFIIIDDASTDRSSEILKHISDQRVRIITNSVNLGNYASRNIGIKASLGEFICVMDADDLALPYRLERQMYFMLNNPDVGICSTWFRRFGLGINTPVCYPSDEEWLKIYFMNNNYCLHPGLCIRKNALPKEALFYNEKYKYASDYDFVSQNFKHFRICNIPEILMEYRVHSAQITASKYIEQQEYADCIRINYLQNIELALNDEEKAIHLSLVKSKYNPNFDFKEYILWSNKILKNNFKIMFFDSELLSKYLREKLFLQRRIIESQNY